MIRCQSCRIVPPTLPARAASGTRRRLRLPRGPGARGFGCAGCRAPRPLQAWAFHPGLTDEPRLRRMLADPAGGSRLTIFRWCATACTIILARWHEPRFPANPAGSFVGESSRPHGFVRHTVRRPTAAPLPERGLYEPRYTQHCRIRRAGGCLPAGPPLRHSGRECHRRRPGGEAGPGAGVGRPGRIRGECRAHCHSNPSRPRHVLRGDLLRPLARIARGRRPRSRKWPNWCRCPR